MTWMPEAADQVTEETVGHEEVPLTPAQVGTLLRERLRENEPKWTMVVPSPTRIWLKIAMFVGIGPKPNLKVEFGPIVSKNIA